MSRFLFLTVDFEQVRLRVIAILEESRFCGEKLGERLSKLALSGWRRKILRLGVVLRSLEISGVRSLRSYRRTEAGGTRAQST